MSVSNQLVNVEPRRDMGAGVWIGDSPEKKKENEKNEKRLKEKQKGN